MSSIFREKVVYSTADSTVMLGSEGNLKPYYEKEAAEQLLNDVAPTVGDDQE